MIAILDILSLIIQVRLIKDYMNYKKLDLQDDPADAATMKGIKKANMNMNMFYTANGTDGEEMSNNVDYG